MSTNNTTPRRPQTTILAAFDILVGVVFGGCGLVLTSLSALSVHPEDSLPPLGLAVASGLLGIGGMLLLAGSRRGATVASGLAAVAAGGGMDIAFCWVTVVSEMWLLALVTAPVALVAMAEVVYLRRVRPN